MRKSPILIWRVLRHFLTGFPLLDNLIVLEAKDVDQRDPRTTRREPNSPVNRYKITIFKSAHRFKILLGKCGRIFLHRGSQRCAITWNIGVVMAELGMDILFVRFPHIPGGSQAQEGDGHLFVVHRSIPS